MRGNGGCTRSPGVYLKCSNNIAVSHMRDFTTYKGPVPLCKVQIFYFVPFCFGPYHFNKPYTIIFSIRRHLKVRYSWRLIYIFFSNIYMHQNADPKLIIFHFLNVIVLSTARVFENWALTIEHSLAIFCCFHPSLFEAFVFLFYFS